MKKLITLGLLTATVFAQTADAPIPAGNTAVLGWNANPPDEGVTAYAVYRTMANVPVSRLATVADTQYRISTANLPNGTYSFAIAAISPAGEGPLSTNIFVRYWANKPTPPTGLRIQ